MTKRVSRYRVTASVMSTLVGKVAELIINTTRNSVHVHDGATAGGFELARADMSNVPNPDGSTNGRMTAALYTEFKTATTDITTLQEQMTTAQADILTNASAITSLSASTIPKVSSPVANSFVFQTASGTLIDAGFNFTKGTTVMAFGSAIPSRGWTLDASWNDVLPIGLNGAGGGSVVGSSWTITGLSGTQPTHTHAFSGFVSVGSAGNFAGGATPAAAPNTAPGYAFSGTTNAGGSDAVTVTHAPGWRPLSKYVAYASLNA